MRQDGPKASCFVGVKNGREGGNRRILGVETKAHVQKCFPGETFIIRVKHKGGGSVKYIYLRGGLSRGGFLKGLFPGGEEGLPRG